MRRRLLAALVAATTALRPSIAPARIEHPKLATLAVGDELRLDNTRTLRRLAAKPSAFYVRGALPRDDCDAIIKAATQMATARTAAETDARKNCQVAWLAPPAALTAEVASWFLSEEAMASGGGCEDLQVLRYASGGNYALHHDSTPDAPRCLTVLYYLNGVGNTWLPLADGAEPASRAEARALAEGLDPATAGVRTSAPAPGDALAFFSCDADGALDWACWGCRW
mmetsp:Transcript_3319/g.9768  ORF Transcript_3319/g.9768 Transcript_3319/m.9768 type:complete len:226 (-) Transcript_3319:432-1109(-)